MSDIERIRNFSIIAHIDHGNISPKAAIQIAAKATNQLTFKDFGFNVEN
jgi:translation elongation factor EF-4